MSSAQQRPVLSKDEVAAMSKGEKDVSLDLLVRRWLTTSESIERQSRAPGDTSPPAPTWTPPREDPHSGVAPVVVATPALPRRRRQPISRPTRRLAVLIDAENTAATSAEALFESLADQGTVSVCRAYGDWTSTRARAWWPGTLRQHAIQPHHHFGQASDQRALVALTIDAVDLASQSAVDAMVVVGDLASLHPLVARLNASGIQVIAVGTTPTPPDVRALCHEFVELTADPGSDGKHRA